jgi:hypothetical protein
MNLTKHWDLLEASKMGFKTYTKPVLSKTQRILLAKQTANSKQILMLSWSFAKLQFSFFLLVGHPNVAWSRMGGKPQLEQPASGAGIRFLSQLRFPGMR